jgi:hypothetical protein
MTGRAERAALLAMAAGLSLATVIALAFGAPVKANGLSATASIQDRATAWHRHRAVMLGRLKDAQAKIEALGGVVRVPPELAVRFDQASLQDGLQIIQAPAADLGDVVAKIGIARALDLPELRTQYGMEAIEVILADVEVVGDECE